MVEARVRRAGDVAAWLGATSGTRNCVQRTSPEPVNVPVPTRSWFSIPTLPTVVAAEACAPVGSPRNHRIRHVKWGSSSAARPLATR